MKFSATLLLAAVLSLTNAGAIVESDTAKEILVNEMSGGKTLFVKWVEPSFFPYEYRCVSDGFVAV